MAEWRNLSKPQRELLCALAGRVAARPYGYRQQLADSLTALRLVSWKCRPSSWGCVSLSSLELTLAGRAVLPRWFKPS